MSSGTKQISLVFFGSGPVAAQSLAFLNQHYRVETVITKPATKHEMAALTTAPVLVAANKQELDELVADQNFTSRLGVLVDFGIIVSQKVINTFRQGIINSHFSLLPRWRGADPISFAILGGDSKTGVSLMLIEPSLDTGKLLTQKSLKIKPEDTTPQLTDRLVTLSNQLLLDYIPSYVAGTLKPKQQPHPDRATYSRKLTKEDGLIDWHKPAENIEREIRAFAGWPSSRTQLAGKEVIITRAHATPSGNTNNSPGSLVKKSDTFGVATADGTLWVEKLKPAGKKDMGTAEFLRGYGQRL